VRALAGIMLSQHPEVAARMAANQGAMATQQPQAAAPMAPPVQHNPGFAPPVMSHWTPPPMSMDPQVAAQLAGASGLNPQAPQAPAAGNNPVPAFNGFMGSGQKAVPGRTY
jgi:hypothetical protein